MRNGGATGALPGPHPPAPSPGWGGGQSLYNRVAYPARGRLRARSPPPHPGEGGRGGPHHRCVTAGLPARCPAPQPPGIITRDAPSLNEGTLMLRWTPVFALVVVIGGF